KGVGAVSVVQVDPAQDRLVLPADASGAGGGVELAGGDQVQGLETLPAARVRLVQRGPTQVLHRLLPLRRLHLDHPPAPRWVVVGAIAPPYPIPALRNGNSWFHPDRGLAACGVTTVALESTGVYWIPLFELLESRGFEVILIDPGTMPRNGRPKTDIHDCQWIQRLHTLGLLSAAFRPDDPVVVLRSYLRLRLTLL